MSLVDILVEIILNDTRAQMYRYLEQKIKNFRTKSKCQPGPSQWNGKSTGWNVLTPTIQFMSKFKSTQKRDFPCCCSCSERFPPLAPVCEDEQPRRPTVQRNRVITAIYLIINYVSSTLLGIIGWINLHSPLSLKMMKSIFYSVKRTDSGCYSAEACGAQSLVYCCKKKKTYGILIKHASVTKQHNLAHI